MSLTMAEVELIRFIAKLIAGGIISYQQAQEELKELSGATRDALVDEVKKAQDAIAETGFKDNEL